MNTFSKTLLNWYKEHKRELPWRESSDPYLIWISEIILQQT
nr:A/G-specific adenine glycosylase [Bacteroides sp.]